MADTSDPTAQRGQPTEDQPPVNTPEQLCNYWLTQIAFAEKKMKSFRTRGNQIVRRYKNMRSTATPSVTNITIGQRRMNVLWANVQTLMPVLYSQTPKPNITRRNKDKDPVGRWAAIVLERVLTNTIAMQGFDHVMQQDMENLCLPGFACSMVEYMPEVTEEGESGEATAIGWQEAKMRYVDWKDQLTNPCRYWQEVTWWGYVSYLTRREVSRAYGRSIGAEIALDHKASKDANDSMSKASVWCIWDKTSEMVYHVSPGYTKAVLGEYEPPVEYEGFFPIPRPLVATTASDSIIPTPDFDQYQDQADEIDMFTQRIYVLGRSLKLRGLYPGDMQSVRQLMDEGTDADLIPVENWAMFQERGGANGLVAWFPFEQVAETLKYCYEARDQAVQTMYQITGISDIMRGDTAPEETMGAQQIKAQYGAVRVRDRQRDVQRYIREILRHMTSIVGQHFTPEVIQKMSGAPLLSEQEKAQIQQYMQLMQQFQQIQMQWQQAVAAAQQQGLQPPPQPQPPQMPQVSLPPDQVAQAMQEPSWEQVIGLLRDEHLRGFVIDIETDSTIEADQMAQQQKATQFLTGVAKFMEAMLPMVQAGGPAIADLAGELLMFGVRHFKAGETIETAVENAVEQIKKQAQTPQPNPKMLEAQAKVQVAQTGAQTAQIKGAAEIERAKIDLASTVAEHHANMREKAADMQVAQAQNVVPMRPGMPPELPQ